jgi:DNA-binding NtrC family response regulator
VLVAEDDDLTRASLRVALEQDGYSVTEARDGGTAMARLKRGEFDVAVLDVMMGEPTGLDVLEYAVREVPEMAVIMVTGFATVETAVEAMKRGAQDFLTKPIDIEKLSLLIGKCVKSQRLLAENRRLRDELRERFSVSSMIGKSPRMLELFRELERVARTSATVLLRGESGVGKELCANAIHLHSDRHDRPLVKVACAALGAGVLESELFGHVRGAFTGAVRSRKGRFEQADGGTLFLDEVGDLEAHTQVKLLRVLQERCFERVGDNESVQVDVRVIAATNRDLEAAIAQGQFREDLYYRLNVVPIQVPALRDHPSDVALLADAFLQHFAALHGRPVQRMSKGVAAALSSHSWPGNVRELRNCVEGMVISARGRTLDVEDLPPHLARSDALAPKIEIAVGTPLDQIEREVILRTLALAGGNKAKAARMLGIGLKTLYRRLEDYGLAVD